MPNLGIKYVGSAQLFYIKYVGSAQLFYIKYVGSAQLFYAQFGNQYCWLFPTYYIKK
jgi:hypothetical protein